MNYCKISSGEYWSDILYLYTGTINIVKMSVIYLSMLIYKFMKFINSTFRVREIYQKIPIELLSFIIGQNGFS